MNMYCDTTVEIYKDRERGDRQSILENWLVPDLRKIQAGDCGLQSFALYVNLKQVRENPFEFCIEFLDTFYQEMETHEDITGIVRAYDGTRRSWEQGRMSALLTVEKGGTCQGKTVFLRDLYRLGVRMMTLTWSFPNELASPNARIESADGTFKMVPDTEHGFTDIGTAFVEEIERLGMIVGISHLSDANIWDMFRYTSKPFVASHSNARVMASHPRDLTDDMIRALAERGGVMGINYCMVFLQDFGLGEEQLNHISDMVEHMKHIRKIGDTGCIGLGSDFDGISENLKTGDAGKLPILADATEQEGFTASEIEAIFCKDMLRMCKDIL